MKRIVLIVVTLFFLINCYAQKGATINTIQHPKLVVGIVVDQMRWDYLYRFYDLYKVNGGFKRLMGEGFTCDNTLVPYLPTVTACGHTCVYTGSVPAIHGITGNNWFDNNCLHIIFFLLFVMLKPQLHPALRQYFCMQVSHRYSFYLLWW